MRNRRTQCQITGRKAQIEFVFRGVKLRDNGDHPLQSLGIRLQEICVIVGMHIIVDPNIVSWMGVLPGVFGVC